ncbi:MAG: retron St85 family effector protein [bacterium]
MPRLVEELENFPTDLIAQLKMCIQDQRTFLKSDAVIVFTCGSRFNSEGSTPRERLLQYGKRHLKQFQFFVAEEFFNPEEEQKIDLLTLEDNLGNYSDCIIIILDSESTFAELGAFTNSPRLENKLLVINDVKHNGNNSFLSLGPLARINQKSKFKPVIYTNLTSFLVSLPEIEKRLSKIKRENQQSIDLSSYEKIYSLDPKKRILFILDLIQVFSPISHREIITVLKEVYGDKSYNFINMEIGLLKAMKLIDFQEKYYFREGGHSKTFYNFRGIDFKKFRSKIVGLYHKTVHPRLKFLAKRALAANEEVSD